MRTLSSLNLILLFIVQTTYSQVLENRGVCPDGAILDMELKGDILYIGGSFDQAGFFTGGIARLDGDDTVPKLSFPFISGEVYTIIPDGSGGWFVGGDFDEVNLEYRYNVVHILPTMEVDPSFFPEVNNTVNILVKQNDILYMGGWFSLVDGESRSYLAAYDLSTNSLDQMNPGPNGAIHDMIVYQNELIVGGAFTVIGDSAFRGLANIDLVSGTVNNFPDIATGQVNALFVDENTLYAAGNFSGGAMSVDLATKTVSGWNPGVTGFAFSMRVNDIYKKDSVIYLAGGFTGVMGEDRKNIAAVSEQGNLLDFAPEPDAEVFSIFMHESELFFGGDFVSIASSEIAHIAKFNASEELITAWNLSPDWTVHAFATAGNQMIIGGEFEMLHARERDNAYAVNTKTGKITSWKPESNFLTISDLKVDEFRNIVYLAGWDSKNMQNLKAFDGTTGEKIESWDLVFDNSVTKIDQHNVTGNIYVVGGFMNLNGEEHSRMALLDTAGNILPLNLEADDDIFDVVVSEEHDLVYITGEFNSVNSETRHKVAAVKFDGSLAAWDPKPALSHLPAEYTEVNSLLVQSDKVLIGGKFDSIAGVNRPSLAAVEPTTAEIMPWDAQVVPESTLQGSVDLIQDFQNGVVITGTGITEVAGQTFIYFARLGNQSAQRLNLNEFGYYAIENVVSADSILYLGGDFRHLDNSFHPFFAELSFASTTNLGDRIEGYSPKEGGNKGDLTIEIIGTGFTQGSSVILRKSGFADIESVEGSTFLHDEERISATFDLREVPLGLRDIVIDIPGDTTMVLTNAFTIIEGSGAQPWADMIAPSFVTRRAEEYFYLSYGNSGDIDAHGVRVWLTFSPNIEVKDIDFDLIRLLDESDPYYDSVPEFITTDSLFGKPYEAKVYSFIIPKVPAGYSNIITIRVVGEENGAFYTRAWVDEPMFGSPLKYWVSECEEAIMMKVLGVVPYASCVSGYIDLTISPFVDLIWDPNFGTSDYAMSHIELMVGTFIDCLTDLFPNSAVAKSAGELISEFLNAKSWFDLAKACSEQGEDKEDTRGDFVSSMDPNDKTGPTGQGEAGWLNTNRKFAYMIRFENDPEATASAKQVVIKDTLNTSVFDLSTFNLKGFTIADSVYSIPSGFNEYETVVDQRPRLPYLVKLTAALETKNGAITWEFTTLDTNTMEPITDPLGGFLPPDTDSISGRGSVFYDVSVFNNLKSGTTINNKAAIFFDYNDPIITNDWQLIADNDLPQSNIIHLPDTIYSTKFELHWTGQDEGSGIKYYDIKYRENGGNWYYAAAQFPDTSMTFQGTTGVFYEFISVAHDSALNRELEPKTPDAAFYLAGNIQGIDKPGHLNEYSFRIWPNPVNEYITIDVTGSIDYLDVSLMEITGRIVSQIQVTNIYNQRISLPAEYLPKGLYILKLYTGGTLEVKRIVKN